MTREELEKILTKSPEEIVKDLQKTSYPNLPKWDDLVKQFDPMQHSIWNETTYPPKLNDNNQDDFKRTALGLQKLAVSRVAQSMFSTPTKRTYNYDKKSEQEQKIVDILEQVYRTDNYIDSENIERAKKLNASCQIATVWYAYEQENIIEGESSKLKLGHTTYSEMDGYKLYPILDENGNMLVISIGYTDAEEKEHMDVYINAEIPQYIRFDKIGDWIKNEDRSKSPLEVFPVVYAPLPEPIWGGDAGTNLVEQLEEMESYQGLYIKRNALPTFTQVMGDVTGMQQAEITESSNDSRRIIKLGVGGSMEDVTWAGADEAITSRYNRIRNAYFEQVQMPDTSFANMINSNTSAENKELLFVDAKAKAKDLGGEWEKLFYDELIIVKKFAAVFFPKFAKLLETISIRSTIIPYSIKSKKENAEFVATGGGAMSLATQVAELGLVDDVNAEVEIIQEERGIQSNQLQ